MPMVLHEKRRQLTAEELEVARREIVDGMAKVQDIQAEKKAADKEFSERLKPIKSEVDKLMAQVRTGLDIGRQWCDVVIDPVTRTVKFIHERRFKNPDTMMWETENVVFDEKTFEEVGEKQLTLWSEEQQDEKVDDALQNIPDEEWDRLNEVLAGSEYRVEEVVRLLSKPWSAEAAECWLACTGEPSTTINVMLSTGRLTDALDAFAEGCCKIVDTQPTGALLAFARDLCWATPYEEEAAVRFKEEVIDRITASYGPNHEEDESDNDDDDSEEASDVA
jgi:hypothetical protein